MSGDGQGFTRINNVRCPACGSPALFVGSGGYITCGNLSCPNPDYEEALAQHTKEAVLKARIDELEHLLHKDVCEVMGGWSEKCEVQGEVCPVIRKRLAELAAAEQKRGGDADRS